MAGMPPNTCFQVFFFPGSSVTTPWQAHSHHKSQRWPSCKFCMSQIRSKLLSVGHMLIESWSCAPLSLSLSSIFCRILGNNQLERSCAYYGSPTQAICNKITGASLQSVVLLLEPFAAKLQKLYVSFMNVLCVLVVCTSHARLSLSLSIFFSQGLQSEPLDGHDSTTNINVDRANATVCPHFFFFSVGHRISAF